MTHAKEVLADQLLANANDPSWYTPFMQAVEGLTEEDAFWKPNQGSNSIAEIVYHLYYWNKTWQTRYQEGRVDVVPRLESNDLSFVIPEDNDFDTLQQSLLDTLLQWQDILTAEQLEEQVGGITEPAQWWGFIANAATHNAYHIGQIIYIRKLQNSWRDSVY